MPHDTTIGRSSLESESFQKNVWVFFLCAEESVFDVEDFCAKQKGQKMMAENLNTTFTRVQKCFDISINIFFFRLVFDKTASLQKKKNGEEATEKYYNLMKNSKRPAKLFSMEMDFQDPLFFFITFVVAFGLSLISFSFPKWSGVIDTPFILRKVLLHHPVLFTILKALSAAKWANFSFPSLPLASLGIIIGSKDMKTNVRFAQSQQTRINIWLRDLPYKWV